MRKHIDFELSTMRTFYSTAVNTNTDAKSILKANSSLHCKFEEGKLIFNSIPFSISKIEKYRDYGVQRYHTLTDYEIDGIVDNLILEVSKQYTNDFDCRKNSSIYKIKSLRI